MALRWLCPDYVWEGGLFNFWKEKLRDNGPLVSGFLFGLGWWIWIDAVVANDVKSFPQFIPGIMATVATVIMNLVNGEAVSDYDPFDDMDSRRARFWLLVSYGFSFGSFLGSIIILITEYAVKHIAVWPGVVSKLLLSSRWQLRFLGVCVASVVTLEQWLSFLLVQKYAVRLVLVAYLRL